MSASAEIPSATFPATTEFLDGRVTLHAGDCMDVLARIEADSIDCVVTSPPYWGLRDYSVEGQLGLEPTLAGHIEKMVEVFAAIRRVLKPTGTVWLNYGDCYATTPNGRSAADTKASGNDDRAFRDKPFSTVGPIYDPTHATGRGKFVAGDRQSRHEHGGRVVAGGVLKPKDLCMIPNRLAIALQDDGWWVRSEIIWGKSNPMPDSSGSQRPSTAHEKIFLLTKSADADVWRARDTGEISFEPDLNERCPLIARPDMTAARWLRVGHYYDAAAVAQDSSPNTRARISQDVANHARFSEFPRGKGRYLRNYEPAPVEVWPIAARSFKAAHFATFPPELAERCIKAGCPRGGLVLDPFAGAGTTGLVAARLARRAVLIEINPDYCQLAFARIDLDWSGPDERRGKAAEQQPVDDLPMFAHSLSTGTGGAP